VSGTEAPPQGTTDGSGGQGSDGGGQGTDDQSGSDSGAPDQKTYDEKYVTDLRNESASHRVKATKATTKLLEISLRGLSDVMADPNDLLVYEKQEDLLDEDGLPDLDIMAKKVEDLLKRKPHLAKPRFNQDIGQGKRGKDEPETRDFATLLREAAG
jgi:hypothetical protein